MGIFGSSSKDDDEGESIQSLTDRSQIKDTLQKASAGDSFTVKMSQGMVIDFTVETVEDGFLYGQCELWGPYAIKTRNVMVHEVEEGDPSPVGHGIEELQIVDLSSESDSFDQMWS